MNKIAYRLTKLEDGPALIRYLKSLGGSNIRDFRGNAFNYVYYIDEQGIINMSCNVPKEYTVQDWELSTSNEVKIEIPEGYEIDKERSTFECIKFKKKELTYDEIKKKVFSDLETFKRIGKKYDTLLKLLVLEEYYKGEDQNISLSYGKYNNEFVANYSSLTRELISFTSEGYKKTIDLLKTELEEYFKD